MPNGPWTAYSGGFQNGMTLAITPKNVVLRDNSLKPLLQCINYVILKIFKIETFWSTLMAKFMLLGVIGMCSINFMQKKIFLGGHAFWLTQNSWNAPFCDDIHFCELPHTWPQQSWVCQVLMLNLPRSRHKRQVIKIPLCLGASESWQEI